MCNGEILFFDAKVKTFHDIKKLISNLFRAYKPISDFYDVLLRHVKNCNCVLLLTFQNKEIFNKK